MYILFIDSDQFMNTLVEFVFHQKGHEIVTVDNSRGALQMIQEREPGLLILDTALPHYNGFEVVQLLRAQGYVFPVIFVTARDSIEEKLQGFEVGADDYVCKPFNHQELLARAEAVLRRTQSNNRENNRIQNICVGDIELFLKDQRVVVHGQSIALTPKETEVLRILMENSNHVVKREQLLRDAWNDEEGNTNIVDVYICRLRSKIKARTHGVTIVAVRRVGYKFIGR